ncbi:type III secretion protein [Pseudomonas straminea]|nr:type III secretion protein [Pseudomonas straminea]
MDGLAAGWIRWWYAAGDPASPGWPVGANAEHMALALRSPISRHACIAESRAVRLAQPPEPHQGLLRWIGLSEAEQVFTLHLVEGVCALSRSCDALPSVDERWCRSLAKALRPGLWLPAGPVDARLLLGAWVGPQRWARVRLQWPSAALDGLPPGLPGHRLDTLWSAVLWRVARGGEHAGQA